MQKINYKSDFDFVLELTTDEGLGVGFPEYDFWVVLSTSRSEKTFTASCVGGLMTNLFDDNGLIHVVCDSHGLGLGELEVEFRANLTNTAYPDDAQLTIVPMSVDIELVKGATELPESSSATVSAAMVLVTSYELARRAGFEGTEQDFYTALGTLKADSLRAQAASESAEAAVTVLRPLIDNADLKADRSDFVVLSEEEYEALQSPDPDKFYYIYES